MTIVTIDFPHDVFGSLKMTRDELAREVRTAATVYWYSQGLLSQGKAADIAGLTRAMFIEELYRRKASVSQATIEEIGQEMCLDK